MKFSNEFFQAVQLITDSALKFSGKMAHKAVNIVEHELNSFLNFSKIEEPNKEAKPTEETKDKNVKEAK